MDAVTYPDPSVVEELASWSVARVDVSTAPAAAEAAGVPAVPAIAIVTADGEILDRLQGFVEAEELACRLRALRG